MPMSYDELIERDKTRDLGAELLQSVRQMCDSQAARVTKVMPSAASVARQRVGLTQTQFAQALGVSVRTLQEWEQGRRNPTPAAQRLLNIAVRHPQVVMEEFAV